MKFVLPLLVLCGCLLVGIPAQAAKQAHAAAKHEPAKKVRAAQPKEPKESGPADAVDVPGKVIKEPNAFHGTKWGTPLAAVPDMTMVEKDGQATYATAEGVVYRIGEAFLSGVVYAFCQDKFAAVMVEYKGRKAHESIRSFLVSKYTKPVEVEGRGDDLGWPVGNVLIRMQFSPEKDVGTLSYFYQPLFLPCAGDDGKAGQ